MGVLANLIMVPGGLIQIRTGDMTPRFLLTVRTWGASILLASATNPFNAVSKSYKVVLIT